jgi:hypothetical protein
LEWAKKEHWFSVYNHNCTFATTYSDIKVTEDYGKSSRDGELQRRDAPRSLDREYDCRVEAVQSINVVEEDQPPCVWPYPHKSEASGTLGNLCNIVGLKPSTSSLWTINWNSHLRSDSDREQRERLL